MTSLIFDLTCSPYCAKYIKNKNANDFREEYPDAVDAIVYSHYVDDLVISFDSEEAAIQICKQLVYIHSHGGFELRNFISNSSVIQSEMNTTVNLESQGISEKVLGMYWNTADDVFQFETKFHRIPVERATL